MYLKDPFAHLCSPKGCLTGVAGAGPDDLLRDLQRGGGPSRRPPVEGLLRPDREDDGWEAEKFQRWLPGEQVQGTYSRGIRLLRR